MRGRKPSPTHLKVVKGEPHKSRINTNEPTPRRGKVDPPGHISTKARQTWAYVSTTLDDMGVLTQADAIALECLCEAYADYLNARQELKAFGSNYYETTTERGSTLYRLHPAMQVVQEADKRVKWWLSEFGKTPSSRSRLRVDQRANEEPEERFFG